MFKVVLYSCLVYLAVAANSTWKAPWFCHDLECPKYTVLEKHTGYEIRLYEPSMWVSTALSNINPDHSALTGLFFKCFSYIQGSNSRNEHIAMTAPVLDEIDELPNGLYNVSRSFMIPYDKQINPPKPNDTSVFIKTFPQMKVFVESFSGFDIEGQRSPKIDELKMAIHDDHKFVPNRIFSAGYDSPFTFSNRHNEVWLIAV